MGKKIKMTMDNGSIVNFKKITIEAIKEDIESEAKKFFNWRGSTKNYESVLQRVFALGSVDFDKFIYYMHEQGY